MLQSSCVLSAIACSITAPIIIICDASLLSSCKRWKIL